MGGTETALYNLSKCFQNLGYDVIVGGDVVEGDYDGVRYRSLDSLHKNFSDHHFRAIIATSYLHYVKEFFDFSYDKSFFCIHNTDSTGGWWYPYWRGDILSETDSLSLLESNSVTGIVCLTEWHKDFFTSSFPSLKDKVSIIGNGFNPSLIPASLNKIPRSFIYSSHPERGLEILLSNWKLIKEKKRDATLKVCTPAYGLSNFQNLATKFSHLEKEGVSFIGAVDQKSLYKIIAETDYWLYPTRYEETYCITALEMQAMKTCILTCNYGALGDTVFNRGILIEPEENDDILFLQLLNHFLYLEHQPTDKQKMVERAYDWSASQSWLNRAREWARLIEIN